MQAEAAFEAANAEKSVHIGDECRTNYLNKRKSCDLRKEDYEGIHLDDRSPRQRSITLPIRRDDSEKRNPSHEIWLQGSQPQGNELPIKETGMIYSCLNKITTDPTVNPSPEACFHSWMKGHRRPDCTRLRFQNYGRRGVILTISVYPRCEEDQERWLRERRGGRAQREHVQAVVKNREEPLTKLQFWMSYHDNRKDWS